MVNLTSKLVSIKSITGAESTVVNYVKETMISLGFENVTIDEFGNVFGKVGEGSNTIVFDSHLDTVEAGIVSDWDHDPFSGLVVDGKIYGRGSADMKGGFVSSLYGVLAAKDLDLLNDCSAYVVGSIMEEDYEGEALLYILKNHIQKCDAVIICEPSSLKIARGHKGRALIEINTLGVSAHGSSPVHGKNAIYPMIPILNKMKDLENISCKNPESGTTALTKISVDSVSYNAIPASCTLWLDRRIVFGETRENIIGMKVNYRIGQSDQGSIDFDLSNDQQGYILNIKPDNRPATIVEKDRPYQPNQGPGQQKNGKN
jgi:putative selenium metabolism hydrolase